MGSPIKGKKITTPYKKPGKMWALGYHTGVDFACPEGTPILAIADGKVLECGAKVTWGGAYGNAIVVDHGGTRVIYAHLSKIEVKKGAKLIEGQQIGLSGNTGNSSGPHLHLEARKEPFRYGNDVNPAPLLGGVKTSLKAKVTAKVSDKREAAGSNPDAEDENAATAQ